MACNRRGDDDVSRAAGDHIRQYRANRAKHALHVDVDDSIPFVGVALGDVAGDIASRIGEQNVDGTKPIGCRFDHGRDVGRLGQIQGEGDAFGSEFVRQRLQSLGRARDKRELDAFRRKSSCGCGANAGACAGHDHRLVLQASIHPWPPSRARRSAQQNNRESDQAKPPPQIDRASRAWSIGPHVARAHRHRLGIVELSRLSHVAGRRDPRRGRLRRRDRERGGGSLSSDAQAPDRAMARGPSVAAGHRLGHGRQPAWLARGGLRQMPGRAVRGRGATHAGRGRRPARSSGGGPLLRR